MTWRKLNQQEISNRIHEAIQDNINYLDESITGVPASYLDQRVFNPEEYFVKHSPYLSVLTANPNHIGYHTNGNSEEFFKGTQSLETELIRICAEDIMQATPNSIDGYVSPGGTEANLQAIWIYRNYFRKEFQAKNSEIALICSTDTHYSIDKGSALFDIDLIKINVAHENRILDQEHLEIQLDLAKSNGKRFFIVFSNMMTTMFGSVDEPTVYVNALLKRDLLFQVHLDAAYGGFYYPFSNTDNRINFSCPYINSITLDAHKTLQAPYGTGIFLIRKGFMELTSTQSAKYVKGEDNTFCGSRSGANAIAVWMILATYGPSAWQEKIELLQSRTNWFCKELAKLKIQFYNQEYANIVTMKATPSLRQISNKYHFVPDNHEHPNWYKIVIMEHVTKDVLISILHDIKENQSAFQGLFCQS